LPAQQSILESMKGDDDGALNEEGASASGSSFRVTSKPASDKVTLVFTVSKAEAIGIRMIDAIGKVVFAQTNTAVAGENQYPMDLSEFAQGMYMIELQTSHGIFQKKLIVTTKTRLLAMKKKGQKK